MSDTEVKEEVATQRKEIENQIKFVQKGQIKIPEIVPGVTLHNVAITYWPNHKQRGRKKGS